MPKTYEKIHNDVSSFLMSGESHSTLVGKIISLNGKESDRPDVEEFATYIVDLIKKAEQFRKNNVKKARK